MALSTVTVTGGPQTGALGTLTGSVLFTPSTTVTDATDQVIVAPVTLSYPLVGGRFTTAPLVCTDNANLLPPGWTWTVEVQIDVLPRQEPYSVLLPAALGPTVDLSQLVPVVEVNGLPAQESLQVSAGSLGQWNIRLTVPGTLSPYDITGATWEYVVRSGTGPPLIEVTTTAGADGLITVTATDELSSLLLALYPAATVSVAPGSYQHALWMNPGTDDALAVLTGQLTIAATPQP